YRFDPSFRHPLSSYPAAGLSQQAHPPQDRGRHGSDLRPHQEPYPCHEPGFGLHRPCGGRLTADVLTAVGVRSDPHTVLLNNISVRLRRRMRPCPSSVDTVTLTM